MYFKPTDCFPVEIILPSSWYRLSRYRLTAPIQVGAVVIPNGYITDGATVPLLLRWLFPPTGRYFPAAVVHDYILDTERDWPKANGLFGAALNECGLPRWRRYPMHWAVKVYGAYRMLVQRLIAVF